MIFELLLLFLSIFVLLKWIKQSPKNLPPGPLGLPLFGHLFFLGTKPHETLLSWKKKYGPIIYCRFGSVPNVILQDAKLIKQAFSMPELAGRFQLPFFLEANDGKGIIFSENQHNSEQRQFALRNLKDFGVGRKTIESEIHEGIGEFLEILSKTGGKSIKTSEIDNSHVIRTLWSILMTEPLEHKTAREFAQEIEEKVAQLGPLSSQLAIFMPWMEQLTRLVTFGQCSLLDFRTNALRDIYGFMNSRIEQRKESWIKNSPRDITDIYLDTIDDTKNTLSSFHESQKAQGYFTGDLFMAGIDTTWTTIIFSLYYLASNPSKQKKLQDEIDTVIGHSRLPSLADRPNLQYADAFLTEVLRLSSIVPLGVPHRALKDVNFQGYLIPKGTIVSANTWGCHHDPEIWGPDVEEFKPERWFGEQGKKMKNEHFIPFQAGKRVCIGQTLALDEILLYILTLAQKFNVRFPAGQNSEDVKLQVSMGLRLTDFQLVFTPRKID